MISDVGDALDAIIDLTRDKEQAMTNATTQSDIDAETLRKFLSDSRSATMTPRSLVGMTMGARKRHALSAQEDDALSRLMRDPLKVLSGHFDAHDNAEQYRKPYRIGQRLRPCPGCPSCTDSPRLQVIGYARRIGGRVRIDRALDVSGRSAFYVIMFSWRHEGPMQKLRGFETKQIAWEHLQEYWGYRGHLPRLCDGSGVLPARAKKVRR